MKQSKSIQANEIEFESRLTVLCSSPCRTWNECSKMEYMIRPMPNDGSMTLGTISSTAGKTTCVCSVLLDRYNKKFAQIKT